MTENRFDKEIQAALKDYQMDIPSSDWSTMNEKLNEEFGFQDDPLLEKEFDNSISNKMNSDQSEYNHAHWDLLLKRLEKEEEKHFHATIRKILRYVALLLLFISIWNWQANNIFESPEQETQIVDATPTEEVNTTDLTETAIQEVAVIPTVDNKISKENLARVQSTTVSQEINTPSYATEAQERPQLLATNLVLNSTTEKQLDLPSEKLIKAINLYQLDQSSSNTNAKEKISDFAAASIDQSSILDRLSLDKLETSYKHELKTPALDFNNEAKKFSLSLGVMGSPDLFLIRSPEDPIYPLPSYYTESSGLSGGFTFSAEKNNVEILTGISYSSVSYQPRDYVEVYSSRGKFYQTSLNNIFFNSISIPVNFNIYLDVANNSRVYATLGTTFNTIINSNFDIVENIIPQPTGVPNSRTRNSLLDSKDFEEGIFEGGSLFDNTYFTGDIGIGYLRKIKDDWSIYVQPTLHTQYTAGIGPNQDYLHKLSILAGLKYSL